MFHPDPSASGRSRAVRVLASRESPGRRRKRLTPGTECLEVRDCPSGLAPTPGVTEQAHALIARHDAAPEVRHAHVATRHRAPRARAGQVLYVAPRGPSGPNAGKNAAHPLGNLTIALRRAKSGATIVLAPGTYTQNVGMTNKNNITIVGAANQSSVLAPASGQAMKVYTSNNITIQNVWFRSTYTGGIGLAVAGSSVNIVNVKTAGTNNDGVLVIGYAGRNGVLNASSSQFNASQLGNGMELRSGASATIANCTFNGNGTSANATQFSNGLFMNGNATATITASQFNNNTYGGLVAVDNTQVTVQQSSFSGNRNGNGAIFFNQASVNLTGNTFASNGQVVGITTGRNGIEFFGAAGQSNNYTGTAFVSGNTFANNTSNGIYVGSAGNLTVSNNVFSGNIVGLFLDGSGASINATVVGNTIGVAPNPPDTWNGVVAVGTGVTATVGGDGGSANTIQNYQLGDYIHVAKGGGVNSGLPNINIGTNNYIKNGQPVDRSYAVYIE